VHFSDGKWGDKTVQINNYVSTLTRGYIELNQKFKMKAEFSDAQKQVWVITRNESKIIGETNGIFVKQIGINDLINIMIRRLISDSTYKEQQLSEDLISLGSIHGEK
jgi:hypothetical protein